MEEHKCFFNPTSTFDMLGFQCGCGRYRQFTPKEYREWLKDKVRKMEPERVKRAMDKLERLLKEGKT